MALIFDGVHLFLVLLGATLRGLWSFSVLLDISLRLLLVASIDLMIVASHVNIN